MNLKNYLKSNKLYFFLFFFTSSILVCLLVLFIERKILGISSTYHPDSESYLNNIIRTTYSYLSFDYSLIDNIKNFFSNLFSGTLFYSISNLFHEFKHIYPFSSPYRNIIKFNFLIYAITNLLIINYVFKNYEKFDLRTIICLIVFCFMPYKLHLSVNILKEIYIFLFLVLYITYPNIYTVFISLIFGTSLRSMFGFYFLNIIDFKSFKKRKRISLILLAGILFGFFIYWSQINSSGNFSNIIDLIDQRNNADMGGRQYDNIPNFNEKGIYGAVLRSIIWPVLLLSGLFIFFSDNYIFYVIGIEIIFLNMLTLYCKKKTLFGLGIILFLIILGLYVNTFTAYFRYGYLGIQIYFLKIMFDSNQKY